MIFTCYGKSQAVDLNRKTKSKQQLKKYLRKSIIMVDGGHGGNTAEKGEIQLNNIPLSILASSH